MPELPDVLLYQDALNRFVGKQILRQLIVRSPFVMRTVDIPLEALKRTGDFGCVSDW